MLCMNCQYGVGSSTNGDSGFDAGVGAYGCILRTVGVLQTKHGSWFYEYSKGSAQVDISSGNNNTGECPAPSSTTSMIPTTGTTQPTSTSTADPGSASTTPVGAIAGGVVGGVVALAAAVLLGFFISRRRKSRGVIDLTEENKGSSATFEPYNLAPGTTAQPVAITPYATSAPAPAPSSTDWTSSAGSPPPTQASGSRAAKPGLIAHSPPNRQKCTRLSLCSLLMEDPHQIWWTDTRIRKI
ncbi:hypothetical protein RHS01_06775 [Rhizoctonia solani]|uniref:Uncharacterized protein n=1 Tax=Rhizoctonia solani TaxID=456999 RepID=A0A8H7IAA7_9AGAM|nr:hypothetical protein RHS01_06775 [Rhizoctonia solani]